MPTVPRWKSPAGGVACLNTYTDYWYWTGINPSSYPCPAKLGVNLNYAGGVGGIVGLNLSLNFAGRGKVGNSCGGSDPYITFNSAVNATIDLWEALRDGVWTSSFTIEVFINAISGPNGTVEASIRSSSGTVAVFLKSGVSYDVGGGCPTTVRAVITVTDDGDVSIA